MSITPSESSPARRSRVPVMGFNDTNGRARSGDVGTLRIDDWKAHGCVEIVETCGSQERED